MSLEEKKESKKQKALKEELEWIRSNPKARQAKSKARIKNYEVRAKESLEGRSETNEIFIPSGPRLGNNVISALDVSKGFDDKILYDNLNFSLPPGGIVGIIGANGAGKTTLFKMIIGQETPTSGEFKIGESVQLAYVDQERDMKSEKTIYEVISDDHEFIDIGGINVNSRAYIAKFNFSGEDQRKKVSELSGGERNRVHLAKVLKEGGNVLLLDEPTNDLDVNTLQALEKALVDYAGCAVIISHDRFFLDRLATHILAFEGEGNVIWFEGNFADYEEDKKRRLGENSINPRRYTYKKLTRD